MPTRLICLLCTLVVSGVASVVFGQTCVGCHEETTPRIVTDWQLSRHAQYEVTCSVCHGDEHRSADDVAKVEIPTPETCATCHETQVEQFKRGKHALAWAAMEAMPMLHWQPLALTQGMKGCGGCHKIGLKSEENLKFGLASCDACHTRHLFSVDEAAEPQACQTCHMGFDHPQWEMYSTSKHGVRNDLRQKKLLPWSAAAPTCQNCHMQQGDHEVRTAWGFLGLRLPMPDEPQWSEDRKTILQALGVLDEAGKPTARMELAEAADLLRTTDDDWNKERKKMLATCRQCHSENFARGELEKGDEMIREADAAMAAAIRIIAGLYRDGILKQPEEYDRPFPDLLAFHDAPTTIENRLFKMFFKHRMRAFQGTFHGNPDYALWYGWSEMRQELTAIAERAEGLRGAHKAPSE